jgi:hypothetical protein
MPTNFSSCAQAGWEPGVGVLLRRRDGWADAVHQRDYGPLPAELQGRLLPRHKIDLRGAAAPGARQAGGRGERMDRAVGVSGSTKV